MITDKCSLRTATVTITVSEQCVLTVSPTKSAANKEEISITASGGKGPYVYEISAPAEPCGSIDPLSGDYMAPSAESCTGTDTIMATDISGCTGTTQVKISSDAVSVKTSSDGSASITITEPTDASVTQEFGAGTLAGNVYTAASGESDVAILKVTDPTSGEWARVIIRVENGTCKVKEPIAVTDVDMNGVTTTRDLTPIIDWILGL
jgi:hypothetical protein